MRKNIFVCILVLVLSFLITGCGSGSVGTNMPDPDKIVPQRDTLIRNLEDGGYTIEELTTVEGSDLIVDRVMAEKDEKFIDIVYGLSSEDSSKVFELYSKLYPDDYYILAQNGNYVYCVSDKQTFSRAGFTSTENVGVQCIDN